MAELLDGIGEDGWELVSTIHDDEGRTENTFKRPKADPDRHAVADSDAGAGACDGGTRGFC
jgi:hypothetical protein